MSDEQTPRDVGLSQQKARTIRALAEQADDGLLEPDKLAAMTALNQLDGRITPQAAERRSAPWRPYRSYATAYLWGYVWELHPRAPGGAG